MIPSVSANIGVSLERRFGWLIIASLLPTFMMFIAMGISFDFNLLGWSTIGLSLAIVYTCIVVALYRLVITPFYSLTSLTEALKMEDYSLRAKSPFSQGIVAKLFNELSSLSQSLQVSKSRYDQQMFLLYGLIEQLESPVLILDKNDQLQHANPAVSQLFSVPWQTLKQKPAQKLGLIKVDGFWAFDENNESNTQSTQKKWQIRQSEFKENNNNYQLLMLNNISQELQKNEQQAWQNIIRILNHEVRNSLTPISALSQNLLEMPDLSPEQYQQAITIIDSRSNNLLAFIDSYSDLAKLPSPTYQQFDLAELLQGVARLVQQVTINLSSPLMIKADKGQLEQVLLNLIKNGKEAQLSKAKPGKDLAQESEVNKDIEVQVFKTTQQVIIKVLDQGCGIANSANLFVPFYTTKETGSGIGLALSRQIISNHQGELTLTNRTDLTGIADVNDKANSTGAIATITLPLVYK